MNSNHRLHTFKP